MGKDKRKRRTRGHMIADLAVHHVEGYVLRSGFTMLRIVHDYGLDAAITTYSAKGEVESGVIWLQIKATDQLRRRRHQEAVAVRVQCRDLLSWVGQHYPVILVVFDARLDRAYWLHVQNYLGGGKVFRLVRGKATLTLDIPAANIVNDASIRHFRKLKAAEIAWYQKGPDRDA